jgi:hypothetical protein
LTPSDDDLDMTTLHLVRVSQRDIGVVAAKLKEAPGVHEVTVERRRASRQGGTNAGDVS